MNKRVNQVGFSLMEISLVLMVVGLLTAGGLSTFSSSQEHAKWKASVGKLTDLKEHLLSTVKINQYLPCPDTTGDGNENRKADRSCTKSFGQIPYLTVGLSLVQVQDAYRNPIRYAVNTDVTQSSKVCDPALSASYFCNAPTLPKFTLATPPLVNDRGLGNYWVCNDKATNCTGTPSGVNLEGAGYSVVLVAYNKDGLRSTARITCTGTVAKETKENCDTDLYYWNGVPHANDNSRFDDEVIGISGYEIKAKVENDL